MPAQNVDQKVYLGSLDDFSVRHSLTSIRTVKDLNHFLTYTVLMGNPILLNDGFLLSNGILKEAMRNPACSPFTELVDADFITIVSRNNGNPPALREVMQQTGVIPVAGTPDEDNILKDWWEARKKVADRKNAPKLWAPWPAKKMNEGFATLLREGLYIEMERQARQSKANAISMFLEEFADDPHRNRTAAEHLALQHRESGRINPTQFTAIMYVANAAYDLNWAMCLDGAFPGGIQCETLFSDVFKGYYEVKTAQGGLTNQKVKIAMPDVSPKLFSSMNGLWKALATASGELKIQRTDFCRLRDEYFYGGGDARAVLDAAKEYDFAIKKHFGKSLRSHQALTITFASLATATSLDAWGFGTGELESVLCTVTTAAATSAIGCFLTNLYSRTNTRDHHLDGRTFGQNSVKGQGIVAAPNQTAVQEHLKLVPDR